MPSKTRADREPSHADDPTQAGKARRDPDRGIPDAAGLTQRALAEATGLPRKHVNDLRDDRRAVTATTALILARVFGNSADFWLNLQRRLDLWQALHDPRERARIDRAKPLGRAA